MQSTESSYVSSPEEMVRKRTPPPPKSLPTEKRRAEAERIRENYPDRIPVLYGSECDSLCIFWVSGLRSNLSIDLRRMQSEATPLPLLGFLFRSAEYADGGMISYCKLLSW